MKVRVRYTKLGKVRFTSHRDTARIWERALRKAGQPVALSGGFSPRARISFGLALPTGAESLGEYLDVELTDEAGELLDPDLALRLSEALPNGFEVTAVALRPVGASLQEDVVSCTWSITLRGMSPSTVAAAVSDALCADQLHLERERKGELRTDDVRPAIVDLAVASTDSDEVTLTAELTSDGRAVRPYELVKVLFPGVDPYDVVYRVLRTHQWIERDGRRHELMPVDHEAHPRGAGAGKDETDDRATLSVARR